MRNAVAQVTAAARTSAIDLGVAGEPVVVVAETETEPDPDELSARGVATRDEKDNGDGAKRHHLECTTSHPCIMP